MGIIRFAFVCLFVVTLAAAPAAFAQDRAKNRAAFEKEWIEVVKKYPNVARAYVEALEAVAAAREYAETTDQRYYRASRFHIELEDLCDGVGLEWIYCDPPGPKPTQACLGCNAQCGPQGDTINCRQCQLENLHCRERNRYVDEDD